MNEPHRPALPDLAGIVPPLVTPLSGRDTLDVAGIERLVEHVIAGGAQGIFLLGTTGEAPSLSYRLRREFIQQVCSLVSRRVHVLVGITDTSFVESLGIAACACEAGADAVVLSTPYYFPAGQTELVQYVQRIAAELPLPLMLYNMPSLTKVSFEIGTLERLAQIDTIVGVKDSGGEMNYFRELVELRQRLRHDWRLFVGPEHLLLEALQLGADGGVSGGANIFPRLFVECYAAYRAADAHRASSLMRLIEQLQQIYSVGKYASRFIKATKCAMSLRGICDDHMAEPFNHFLAPERARVEQLLDALEPRLRDQHVGE